MIGKLLAWWLVGENHKIGFLVGAVASLLMAIPVHFAGLHGLTVYCLLVFVVQVRAYIVHCRGRVKADPMHDEREAIVCQLPQTD